MGLTRLSLENFRIFDSAAFEPDPYGTTVLLGPNGTGKTSILEAVAYLASGRSFRGATRDSLVRQGEASAYLHGAIDQPGHLTTTVDAEINRSGPARMLINKQPARTRSDLSSAVTVTTFAPDDMVVVRGGPGARRELLDEALAALSPQAGPLLETVDRILRQRGALLKQAKGR
ncbi:MAG: AAA family ATPase, partial [Actinomycetota bacterium]